MQWPFEPLSCPLPIPQDLIKAEPNISFHPHQNPSHGLQTPAATTHREAGLETKLTSLLG